MRIPIIILPSILIAAFSVTAASGQSRTFTSSSVDYVIEFPSTRWRALASSGIVSTRSRKEFLYADSNNVRLLVRKKLVDADVTPSEMVRRRQRWDKQLSGYMLLREETFAGQLSGAKFAYEYVKGGKIMSALIYYLEADNRTIYSLLFTGPRDELQKLRDQADLIARSFHLKNSRRS